MTFHELNLSKPLLKALDLLELTEPTHIQREVFSVIMSGRDVLGIAQTGTGKTLAYLLPCLRMWKFTKDIHPQVLIVVPTRELVAQVVEEAQKLAMYQNIKILGVYGGVNMRTQEGYIREGVDFLVATPGRLNDLILNGAVSKKAIKRLIIYEVDEMRCYLKRKDKPMWIVYALERKTKQVVNFSIGLRTKRTLRYVTNTLLLSNPKTIYTDKLVHYKSLLNNIVHNTKPFGTNHIERKNLSLRTHLKRLNRKTICFSRSFILLQCVLRIYFWG